MNTKTLLLAGLSVLAVVSPASAGSSPAPGSYILSGTVASSTAGGGATCPASGATLAGDSAFMGFKKHVWPIAINQTDQMNAVVYVLSDVKTLGSSGKLKYDLPPRYAPAKGTFALSSGTVNGNTISFTMETQTGSLGSGSGTCDVVYNVTLTQGLPQAIQSLF